MGRAGMRPARIPPPPLLLVLLLSAVGCGCGNSHNTTQTPQQAVQRFVTRVVPALQAAGHVDVILMLRESTEFLTDMTLDVRFILTPWQTPGGSSSSSHHHDHHAGSLGEYKEE